MTIEIVMLTLKKKTVPDNVTVHQRLWKISQIFEKIQFFFLEKVRVSWHT